MNFFIRLSPSQLLLRLGLAGSLLYPAIDAWFNPYAWIGYFPTFVTDFVAPHTLILLHTFGAGEIVIALWIVFGKNIRIPCLVLAALLLSIVAFNLNQMEVLFRDVSLAVCALALALMKTKAPVKTAPVATLNG